MLNKIWIYFFVMVAVGFSVACDKNDNSPVINSEDFLIFGHFYGHCLGEQCIEIFKLQDQKLYEDQNDQYVSNEGFYQADFQVLDQDKYDIAKDLWSLVPEAIYEEDQLRFGCPDCADQGGIYLELQKGTFHEYWILDQNQDLVPEYLHQIMDAINQKIGLLNGQ